MAQRPVPLNWLARPYKYPDGVPWNDGRYEIYVWSGRGEWVKVGGAIKTWKGSSVAFLARPFEIHRCSTPALVDEHLKETRVWGGTLKQALATLKWKFPDPIGTLDAIEAREAEKFGPSRVPAGGAKRRRA